MKAFIVVTTMLFSLSSFASWNEVECEGAVDGKTFTLEVERAFPQGSHFKRATLAVAENGAEESHNYTVTTRVSRGMPRIHYTAAGLRLEVDLWPDQAPRWGMTYRASLQSSVLGKYVRGLNCRFPNAF